MDRLRAVAVNTLLQTVRQPIYGLIILCTLAAMALAPAVTGWTLDDDNMMLRDLLLSTLLMQGLFLAAFSAAGVVSVEIEDRTVLTVVSKPIPRGLFIAGKFLGVLIGLALAHYIAILGMLMTLRHGVLQTVAEKSDVSVLLAGPGVLLLAAISAAALNFLLDWKFLPTMVVFTALGLSLSGTVLLLVDRHGSARTYEVAQDIPGLPAGIDPQRDFKGIVTYRDLTEVGSAEPKGKLIRNEWLGPISEPERQKLLELSDDLRWRLNVNFLVDSTRKLVSQQVLKAAVVLFAALMIMNGFAVAVSTRLSTPWTLTLTLLLLIGGLMADYLFRPGALAGDWLSGFAYAVIPNIQFFWLIDAVAQDVVIPPSYIGQCFAYATVYAAGLLAIGAGLFETREVG